ncbi:hypothetical protein L208DRAFT_1246195, partial [Tricholoma matsutake]
RSMSNYRYIPPVQKELICHLSLTLKTHKTMYHTSINICTMQHVLQLWRQTGYINKKPLQAGRPQALTGYYISYIEGLIERQPDIYLCEIQDHLLEAFDINITGMTISSSLHHWGYTRKKVCYLLA